MSKIRSQLLRTTSWNARWRLAASEGVFAAKDAMIGNLGVSGNGFHGSRPWIHPERMGTTLTFEDTAVIAEVPQEGCPLHARLTTS